MHHFSVQSHYSTLRVDNNYSAFVAFCIRNFLYPNWKQLLTVLTSYTDWNIKYLSIHKWQPHSW